jgi:hypothetical protein
MLFLGMNISTLIMRSLALLEIPEAGSFNGPLSINSNKSFLLFA